jgi:hypothetical protein
MTRALVVAPGLLLLASLAAAQPAAMSLRDAASVPAPLAADRRQAGAANAAPAEPISPGKAVLYSLLIPGLGDYMLGNHSRAAVFFAVEGGIWISYAVFETQGSQREDDYQQLAVQFAGVSRTGHSDEFYATIRDYDNSNIYEADVKNDGRFELLEVLTADQLEQYFIENRVDDYEPWAWASHDLRLQYSEVRSSSKTSYRRADYMFAAAAANRLVSAIVAYASARSMRKDNQVGYQLHLAPAPGGVDVAFTLTRSF